MKKFFIASLAILLLSSLAIVGASAADLSGDVNGDGKVDIRDAASILLYVSGKPVECISNIIDTNGDGVIDQNDAETLLQSITGHENVVLSTGDACEHELTYVEGYVGTCPDNGLVEHWVCSKCSKIFKDKDAIILSNTAGVTLEPKHIPGEWVVDTPAGKTENGLKVRRCQNCAVVTDTEVIPYSGSVGLEYGPNLDDSYTVYGGTCTDTEIVIPKFYNGWPVTRIGDWAFSDCSNLTSINIPNSVTRIGDRAFSFCSSLTSITIPDSVTSIEKYTFFECTSLTSIILPNSVTSIGDYAFNLCLGLTNINIPDSVTSIGYGAFSNCTSLSSITIPDSVTIIEADTFYNCTSLTSINIPNSVTSIGDFAFEGCSSLTSITIPNGVTSIGYCAFERCSNLTSITIPDSVTSIGDYAFEGCSSLTSISIPNGVTSIGDFAFEGCSSLTSITIPNGVTSIGIETFYGCSNLTSINIPDSVTSIGAYAFSGCSNLTSINIPDSVTSIRNGAFSNCTSLASINIPDSVTSIGDLAFYDCQNLSSFTFDGTREEWEKVEKGNSWNANCPFTEVIFTKESHIHNFIHVEAKEPTCTVDGYIEHWYCPDCYRIEIAGGIASDPMAITLPASHNLKIVATQNASCTQPGLVIQECSLCKSVIYEILEILPHTESDWITDIEPTEAKDGRRYKACEVCGQITANEVLLRPGAAEHEHSIVIIPATDATCFLVGWTEGQKCEICLEILVPPVEIPLKKHQNVFVTEIPATCTTPGHTYYSCTYCAAVTIKEIPILPHQVEHVAPVAPTCETNGNVEYWYCEVCGYAWLDEARTLVTNLKAVQLAAAHTLVHVEAKKATCFEMGNIEYWYCSECDWMELEGGIATNKKAVTLPTIHNLTIIATQNASCTQPGLVVSQCSLCTSIIYETLEMLPHTESDWIIAFEPTETKDGRRYKVCEVCGQTVASEIILRPGATEHEHSIVTDPAIDATCAPGKTEGKHCEICGAVIVPQEDTPPVKEHEYALVSTFPPSCTASGYQYLICMTCNAEKLQELPVTNHGFSAWTIVHPTATKDGYKSRTCTYCGLVEKIILEATGSEGLAYTLNKDGQSYTVSGIGTCTDTEIVIPSTYEGLPVTAIGNAAFGEYTKLTSITIPDSVTSIGNSAFLGCTDLTSVNISDNITKIEGAAFAYCSGLTSIILPNKVTSIGFSAFQGCAGLTNLNLPNSVTSIGNSAFQGCAELTNITIPDSVTSIGNSVFRDCSRLTSISFLNNLTSIGSSMFNGCTGLTNITIPNGVTSIGELAFRGCIGLTNVTIPNSVTNIEMATFNDCRNLATFIFDGTAAEWEKVEKGNSWNANCPFTEVIFTKESDESHKHNLIHVPAKAPTCFESGNIEYWYCTACDWMETVGGVATNKLNVIIPASHALVYVAAKEATCFEMGNVEYWYCTICGCIWLDEAETIVTNLLAVKIPSLKHNMVHVEAKAATCFESGNIEYWYCTACDWMETVGGVATNKLNVIIPASHTLVFVAAKEATCFEMGNVEYWYCTICGCIWLDEAETIVTNLLAVKIPSLKHNMVHVPPVAPTGSTNGNVEYWYCEVCGYAWLDEAMTLVTNLKAVILPATGCSSGLAFALNEDDQSYSVAGIGTCTDTDIIIPSTYEGKPVTAIGAEAFWNVTSITSVVIPDGVTTIYPVAFQGCTALVSVSIPESLTSFGAFAFAECKNLTTVNIPYGTTTIAFSMFDGCSSLTNITLPDTIKTISDWAFSGCNLTSIDIPDGVSYIGGYAFNGCDFTSVVIPDGVTSICWYTFFGCKNLETVTIPNSVTDIGEGAFQNCIALKDITIPENVTGIGYCAFYDCQSLTSIVIPKNVTSIATSAFEMCSNLKNVTIENGVTTIGKYTFAGCTGITSINIPNSVTSIGDFAFIDCRSLTEITIPNSVTSIGAGTLNYFPSIDNIVFEEGNTVYHVDGNCIIETSTKTLLVGFNNSVIPNDGSVTRIADHAFAGRTGLESIIIPNGVTYIGSYAFSECTGLSNIILPDGVTTIGESAFYNCYNLTGITIPGSITNIYGNAFFCCYNLSNFIFKGTEDEWATVTKGYNWNYSCSFTVTFDPTEP